MHPVRILVRRLAREDLGIRVAWFNDPSVYTCMPLAVPVSLATTQKWFDKIVLDETRWDFCFQGLHNRENDVYAVAMGGLVNMDLRQRRAELYIVVEPKMTGRGIGQNAVQWMCNFGFVHLGLQRIYLYTLDNNARARRLYERVGFTREGILRHHQYHLGEFVDRHIHGLLKSDWQELPWRATGPVAFEFEL